MAGISNEDDWRRGVSQAKRSEQVRYISEVLSNAEPGSTPSQKLMLSMRFEDNTFQTSKSYEDYQRKLVKKLKKLQRVYKPPAQGSDNNGRSVEELRKEEEAAMETELRETYGEKMKFIIENADKAILKLKFEHHLQKHRNTGDINNDSSNSSGSGKHAELLKVHADFISQWAVDIGLFPSLHTFPNGTKRAKDKNRDLAKIKKLLMERVDNVRHHVVRKADPDLHLKEEFMKLEADQGINEELSHILSEAMRPYLDATGISIDKTSPTVTEIKTLIERASVPVPAPRKGRSEDIKEAILIHIDKIRAASQVLVMYLSLNDQSTSDLKDVFKKMHTIAIDGLLFLKEHSKKEIAKSKGTVSVNSKENDEKEQQQSDKKEIKLEDVWNKIITYESTEDSDESSYISSSPYKRQRIPKQKIMVRTRVLLRSGQRTPTYILQALKAKNVQIVRHTEIGAGARVKMVFGTAFEMNVFLSPLLVTFRAIPPSPASEREKTSIETTQNKRKQLSEQQVQQEEESEFRRMIVDGGLPTWKPSGTALSQLPLNLLDRSTQAQTVVNDSVMSSLIAKKLEYASGKATHVLRRCFADMTCTTQASDNKASIEISETSALMKFIQIARATFLDEEG